MVKVKIIADSKSEVGDRITTFEVEYQRFIHSEFMTHRQFSRNAASSRAIPVLTMTDLVYANPAMPIHWGKNQPGMQAKQELQEPELVRTKSLWNEAKDFAISIAMKMNAEGAHKQIINRILEPFQMIKVVMTTTQIENFFYLRAHPDAQPEIQELAVAMREALSKSIPWLLEEGDWHVPYYNEGVWNEKSPDSWEDAIAISSSCCAQVSYRKLDQSIDKARDIYKKLVDLKPVHASPFEHQATPLVYEVECLEDLMSGNWPDGVTHMDAKGEFWSGNFKGWIQHRQMIENHVYEGETK